MNAMNPLQLTVILMTLIIVTHFQSVNSEFYYDYYAESDDPCPTDADDKILACQRYTSCSKCNTTVTNCYCDSVCSYYGDCCEDTQYFSSTPPFSVELNTVACQEQVMNNIRVRVAVITRCPSGASQSAINKCASNDISLLVRGNQSGLIYANEYCAQCYGEDNTHPLTVEVQCFPSEANLAESSTSVEPTADSLAVILYQLLTVGSYSGIDGVNCYLHYQAMSPDYKVTYRSCNPKLQSSCPANMLGTAIDDECRNSPVSYVYEETRSGTIGSTAYKNEKCAQCNGITTYGCKPPPETANPPVYRGFSSLVSLTALSCVRKEVIEGSIGLHKVTKCDGGKYQCPSGKRYKPMHGCVQDDNAPLAEECLKWINTSDYIESGDEITIPHLNLTTTKYSIVDGQALVCVLESQAASSSVIIRNTRPIESPILVGVLLCVSIACLIAQLALYSRYRALRNVAGLILMCLCVAMLIAEALFLSTTFITPTPEICFWPVVFQHYFFLVAFFWMNVMSFDVARMLSAATYQTSTSKKKLVLYNLYAWITPTIFVGAALIAEFSDAAIQPAYGAEGCWFGTPDGLLIYFLAPIFAIILCNVIFYIVSITAIVRAARQTKMVNPDMKERLYLAIKLVIVMGLPWIMGLFTAFFDSIVLNYIFAILNASQGALIFVCYVFSKTVLNLIKTGGRYRSRSSKSYSNQTSTFSIRSRKSSNSTSSRIVGRTSNPESFADMTKSPTSDSVSKEPKSDKVYREQPNTPNNNQRDANQKTGEHSTSNKFIVGKMTTV